ncbi:FAD-binding oxidoreductase [Mucilaginibacter hurinus]|uniref:FAD-binding oxidoreductase n=1 Tax=Mucilaginibacter hurinus TaxID=2201324 RepID=A0A367GP15_9SPHI|nr:FAD-linked oxidase C-terminal domain-containing protein [Mucilaginibacter hurinus]RCH55232.1 FAD-binding oxidoreductase [Mucilaginibacter hurinus]
MSFNIITDQILDSIRHIIGDEFVLTGKPEIERYSRDETSGLVFYPEVVVKPCAAVEIAELLKLCNRHLIPITPRGGGTGLSGGALPVMGGLLLSMERFNKIVDIDTANLQATVEAGVITQVLIDACADKGLYYPIDPSSKGSSMIGGNIAHCSGGPRVVKYGGIREYVLNLEMVLPSGKIIWTGANTLKYSSGYNLTQLMIGAEGTLGIITKAVLRLIPLPAFNVLMWASFTCSEDACAAVSAIFRAGVTPSALEFIERPAVELVLQYSSVSFTLHDAAQAFLLIEVDGADMDVILKDADKINNVLESFNCTDVLFADTAAQKEGLWRIRRSINPAIKAGNPVYKKEDTVVPRALLPQLLKGVKHIGHKYGFDSICFGHAGDGNMHVNIIKAGMSDHDWEHKLDDGITEIFKLTVALGGTISGEHGIGLVQKEFMPVKYRPVHFELWQGIKKAFDPNGILNPGKIF